MAIRIKARSGESPEQMLRRFKKLCEKEGLTKDIRRKEFYEKPSERRRRALSLRCPVVSLGEAEPRDGAYRGHRRGAARGACGSGRSAARCSSND